MKCSFAGTTRECNQRFYSAQRAQAWGNSSQEEVKQENILFFSFVWNYFFLKIFSPYTRCCFHWARWDVQSMKRRNRRQHFQAWVLPYYGTALRESKKEGHSNAFWINKTFIFWKTFKGFYTFLFSEKHCFGCAMHNNFHSLCIWEEYLGVRPRKEAMEWEHRDREPCLSPAAFVNQVQYSNILEGRFKQLQGKIHSLRSIVLNVTTTHIVL